MTSRRLEAFSDGVFAVAITRVSPIAVVILAGAAAVYYMLEHLPEMAEAG